MKRWAAAFVLALALMLTGCGNQRQTDFPVGEKVSAYWFDFTVESVERMERYEGHDAPDGSQLLLCQMTIESTFDGSVPMGRGDFILMWEEPGDPSASGVNKAAFPLAKYADGQLPDEYDMEKGETWEGLLIFEVPDEVDRAAILFEEQYVDGGSESGYDLGKQFTVSFELK